MQLRCQRCKHEWNYSGKKEYYATCPNCLVHVSIKKARIEEVST